MAANLNIDKIKADYNLFIELQIKKYLEQCGKDKFSTNDETKAVVDKIVAVWNNEIADQHERLDSSDLKAKTEWFNSVKIDFEIENLPEELMDFDQEGVIFDELISLYEDVLYYLPEKAFIFLLFAQPALEEYGYSQQRYKKLLDGEEPTGIEIDLLQWAYDLSWSIMSAYHARKKNAAKKHLDEAIQIAEKEFDSKTAVKVVDKIYALLRNTFDDVSKNETPVKAKKKKWK